MLLGLSPNSLVIMTKYILDQSQVSSQIEHFLAVIVS